jgi:hypothetical protein
VTVSSALPALPVSLPCLPCLSRCRACAVRVKLIAAASQSCLDAYQRSGHGTMTAKEVLAHPHATSTTFKVHDALHIGYTQMCPRGMCPRGRTIHNNNKYNSYSYITPTGSWPMKEYYLYLSLCSKGKPSGE